MSLPFVTADNIHIWENTKQAKETLEALIFVEKMTPPPDLDSDQGRRQLEWGLMLTEALARVQEVRRAMKKGKF